MKKEGSLLGLCGNVLQWIRLRTQERFYVGAKFRYAWPTFCVDIAVTSCDGMASFI